MSATAQIDAPKTGRVHPWGLLAVAAALYLLFAHGCHGDEDNELFAAQGRGTSIGTGTAKNSMGGPACGTSRKLASRRCICTRAGSLAVL